MNEVYVDTSIDTSTWYNVCMLLSMLRPLKDTGKDSWPWWTFSGFGAVLVLGCSAKIVPKNVLLTSTEGDGGSSNRYNTVCSHLFYLQEYIQNISELLGSLLCFIWCQWRNLDTGYWVYLTKEMLTSTAEFTGEIPWITQIIIQNCCWNKEYRGNKGKCG